MRINFDNGVLIAITLAITLMLSLNTLTYAFHENWGIEDNKASQFYQTNPNDPAIIRWKNSLQLVIDSIDSMDVCFINPKGRDCGPFFFGIIINCKSHPNSLLACNDSRLTLYISVLKNVEPIPASKLQQYSANVIEKCFINSNLNSEFEVASETCDAELVSLVNDCLAAASPYEYCIDKRFVGYLQQRNF
jgi:hypothetical protein